MIQREILSGAITDILWKVEHHSCSGLDVFRSQALYICQCSGTGEAVVAIPETNPVFEAPVRFAIDSLTEKVNQFDEK